jgi:hypothetical protein
MTKAQFKSKAVALFKGANPDAKGVSIEWTFGPNRVTWADGSQGWTGRFSVSADGFRSREMSATYGAMGWMVR